MPTTFFISDLHLGHRNIIKFEAMHRPYATIEEHDVALCEAWNRTVTNRDTVWVLGDFAFNRSGMGRALGCGLRGASKRLVLGNHDQLSSQAYLDFGFNKLYGCAPFGKHTVLTHAPQHLHEIDRWAINLHGHMHSKDSPTPRHFNVSVERCVMLTGEPRPLAWEEIDPLIARTREAYLEKRGKMREEAS